MKVYEEAWLSRWKLFEEDDRKCSRMRIAAAGREAEKTLMPFTCDGLRETIDELSDADEAGCESPLQVVRRKYINATHATGISSNPRNIREPSSSQRLVAYAWSSAAIG